MTYTLGELADYVKGTVQGNRDHVIEYVATLQHADEKQISFLTNPSYKKLLASTKAGAVILSAADAKDCTTNAIISDDPYVAYARIADRLSNKENYAEGIDPGASVSADASIAAGVSIAAGAVIEAGVEIAESVRIGPNCVVQRNAKIGKDSVLVANVTIVHDCIIGERTLLHPGVVIGADGFGQAMDKGFWIKVPQLGKVVIGNDVEIGANTTVDRGAIEDTVIEDNVKLDNQIQIGHNVQIGAHTAVAASTAIAGSTKIGKHCKIAGMVGIVGHIEIADNVMITGLSLVNHSLTEAGVYSSGIPIDTNAQWRRNASRFKHLDELSKRIRKLEKELASLKDSE